VDPQHILEWLLKRLDVVFWIVFLLGGAILPVVKGIREAARRKREVASRGGLGEIAPLPRSVPPEVFQAPPHARRDVEPEEIRLPELPLEREPPQRFEEQRFEEQRYEEQREEEQREEEQREEEEIQRAVEAEPAPVLQDSFEEPIEREPVSAPAVLAERPVAIQLDWRGAFIVTEVLGSPVSLR
jgi:hypothetical protein